MEELLYLIGAFIAVLWILLPFAVFGIRKDLEKHIEIFEKIESHLSFQNDEIRKQKSIIPQ